MSVLVRKDRLLHSLEDFKGYQDDECIKCLINSNLEMLTFQRNKCQTCIHAVCLNKG